MGTGNDGYACPLLDESLRQTTQQHMEAAVKNGENVIAGVNADFFNNREHGDYAPWGLAIKDGTLLSQKNPERPWLTGTTGGDRPFFGVDFNGNPLIAMESEYPPDAADISDLNMAVGGAYILAEDGKTIYYPNGMTGVIIHGVIDPHTMVGIREDGTVVLMVVDGRRKDYSNGASLLQCSILMQRFGSDDVMLLDGGGSSNMVLRDPVANTYTTVNKPDDGHLRKMFNSILVVKK
jgi:exopolysaccharide biosynthesis protein